MPVAQNSHPTLVEMQTVFLSFSEIKTDSIFCPVEVSKRNLVVLNSGEKLSFKSLSFSKEKFLESIFFKSAGIFFRKYFF